MGVNDAHTVHTKRTIVQISTAIEDKRLERLAVAGIANAKRSLPLEFPLIKRGNEALVSAPLDVLEDYTLNVL